jgi:hypothetical protein
MPSKRNIPRRSTSSTPSMLPVLVGTVRGMTLFLIDLLLTLVRKGPSVRITPELIKQNIAPPSLDNKVKVFVCGEQQTTIFSRTFLIPRHGTGPPGQMKAISGSKLKPMDQGPLTGVLKELGYDETQVNSTSSDVMMIADRT